MKISSLWICFFAILLIGASGVWAESQYQISIAGSVDTPTKTVSVEGNTYQVSAIGRVSPGEQIDFSVNAPNEKEYSVYLYDNKRNIVDTIRLSGDASGSFGTQGLEAGSYVLVINGPDGKYRTVHPVVVSGYQVTVETPGGVQPGDKVTISVDIRQLSGASKSVNHVEIVISHHGSDTQYTATQRSQGTYTATMTLSDPGKYLIYGNVRGTEDTKGHKELIGVSGSNELTVRDPTPTPTSDPPDSEQRTSFGSATPTPTVTPTKTATPTVTPTKTAPPTVTPTVTPTTTQTSSPTLTQQGNDENVITPGTDSASVTRTTVPNRAPVLLLFGVLLSGLVARLR